MTKTKASANQRESRSKGLLLWVADYRAAAPENFEKF
jgi:hypothetical protein